ncbi:NAD-dependent succinate-semialdehyde dehydrogenase [Sphingomonas bacterium]|uniref:NAD-dependent succinate-semialdehyde dehydrogenase n=1 Tax=Sphingomonas bacterium TaxID=1895847 RepID=UPI0015768827|nr:NAD-dependent succinate-semialdehyde dehydrogenase [Sphingomonas bacterium]
MFTSTNPATGKAGETFVELDADEIEQKLVHAHAAYDAWRTTELATRAALLSAIGDRFEANAERLGTIATREMGKTLKSAIAEVGKCVAGFRHYAAAGPDMLVPRRFDTAEGPATAQWQPMGPVLAVMPWNFPYWQVVRFLAPTIMAGNTGLLKHASLTQGCAAAIEEMVLAAGAPVGLFQNLAIRSDKVAALIDDRRIVAVTITGSEGAGKKVAEAAGRNLKKVVLELGGSDPFVVMPSADIDKAARVAVVARTQNSGQSCICAKRMIVHADVYDAFLDAFSAGMKALVVGNPMADETDMGPLSSAEQRDTVIDQIAAIRKAGGRLSFGGERQPGDGAYLSPGIIVDLSPDEPVAQEEIFGPVAMVFRVPDIDHAIALANDIPFGLGASVWTADADERARFERDIQSGMVAVNKMLSSSPQAPFGGIKRSGHGRELGPYGLHEFMNLKTVFG